MLEQSEFLSQTGYILIEVAVVIKLAYKMHIIKLFPPVAF